MSNSLELRVVTEFNVDVNEKKSGIAPIWIGFKTPLLEEHGIIPKISFISHLQLPTIASEHAKAKYIAPQYRFVFQHNLSEKLSVSYNLGMEWDGFSSKQSNIYTLTTGFSLTPRIGFFAEVFGDFKHKTLERNHYFDGGFTYLINSNSMLDISSGFKYLGQNQSYFLSCGYSFRFKMK